MTENFIQYNKYSIDHANENEWVSFLLSSYNPNIFYHPNFIEYNAQKTVKLFVKNNKEILGAILLCISEDEDKIIQPKELLYTPIVFNKNIFINKPHGTINKEVYSVVYNIYEYLVSNFDSIDITFDTCTFDIRPFIWHTFYHKNEKIDVFPLFTTKLTLDENLNLNIEKTKLFKNYTRSKRWEYRKALESNLYVDENINENDFLKIFEETFGRQSIKLNDTSINKELFYLIESLKKINLIKYVVIRNSKGEIENFNIISTIGETASILYSARSKNNCTFSGSFLTTETFKILEKDGIKLCDLEGINSPKRGFNKISYGGSIENYYRIKIYK